MTEMEQYQLLQGKLAILAKIAANTAIQLKFVRRQEIRGLQRLLRERTKLLHSLGMFDERLKGSQALSPRCLALKAQIDGRRQQIIGLNKQTIAAAVEERDKLAAALRGSKKHRTVIANYQYVSLPASGRRFNSKG
ncbi:hypothetical protein HSX37_07035|uniref:FlgN protein n=1 Tax=Dendrosporobacter quercicolus TaxID=146817 RepID=A0A1G9VV61_9FIRM|nr:hypothetical protein [Dendrosporobacter quercicolus]NSL47798.1 hypothetical protein [Dendrosporobacter quercicolus DSM 1736]SDM75757.1 hypothetical protein SAMN04488502_10742 [Dendrosporobacter quercicolus]